MHTVEIESTAGTYQVQCETLTEARAEQKKYVNKDPESEHRYIEGVFSVKVFVHCDVPEIRKGKDGKLVKWYVECTSCGKCTKQVGDGQDRMARFRARYQK